MLASSSTTTNQCPCGLTLEILDRHPESLGPGMVYKPVWADGSGNIYGRPLGAHQQQTGNENNIFRKLILPNNSLCFKTVITPPSPVPPYEYSFLLHLM